MEWSKVKNIIILILVLINGFLLVLVGTRRSEVRRYEQSALTRSLQVLEENGIEADAQALVSRSGTVPAAAERDTAAEARLAGAILGESVEGDHRGGGLYLYQNSRGQVSLRSGGEISLIPSDDSFWVAADPADHAQRLVQRLGLELEERDSTLSGGSGTVTYRQRWNGAPLFSCQLVLSYEDGRLTGLSGTLLAADRAAEESVSLLTLPTVLLRFLDEIIKSGDVCSSIRAVEAGYRLIPSFSGAMRLSSVWKVSTNTADYYLDGVTGEFSRAAEN